VNIVYVDPRAASDIPRLKQRNMVTLFDPSALAFGIYALTRVRSGAERVPNALMGEYPV
jgi:hypothetical protein